MTSPGQRAGTKIDQCLDLVFESAKWLALPLSLLLFAQWPLREVVQAGSREANDLGQLIFALYVVAAVGYASQKRAHLASDFMARHYRESWRRRIEVAGILLFTMPWAAFLLREAFPIVMLSISQLERFPETYNPGYFVLKGALLLLALIQLLYGLASMIRAGRRD
jgi:TRAP-type mannitol/chloroaromatic compound transport system permease small subunit